MKQRARKIKEGRQRRETEEANSLLSKKETSESTRRTEYSAKSDSSIENTSFNGEEDEARDLEDHRRNKREVGGSSSSREVMKYIFCGKRYGKSSKK